jgi:hypothetical protein
MRNPRNKRTLARAMQRHFWVFFGSIWLLVGLPFVLIAGYFIIRNASSPRPDASSKRWS